MSKETLDEYIARNTEGIIEPGVRALAQSYLRYGAQWQAERLYSEEEVKEILEKRDKHNLGNLTLGSRWLTVEDWFEQFKKK